MVDDNAFDSVMKAMVDGTMYHAKATALELAARLLYHVPVGDKPSDMERERMSRALQLPDGMLQIYYEGVGKILTQYGTKIHLSLLVVDNYRYCREEQRGVFAYLCKDEELRNCRGLAYGDGNLGVRVLMRYTQEHTAAPVVA